MTRTGRLYGGTLYDLVTEEGREEAFLDQMIQIRDLFREYPEYPGLLMEPSVPFSERAHLIDEAFGEGAEPYLVNLIKLLCEKGLLYEYAACTEEFESRYDAAHGISRAEVVSAVPLSGQQREQMKKKLEQISGRKIRLYEKVDPSVMGGVRIELDGRQLDGTVQGRLKGVTRRLNEAVV
ncbi:MAG: ATP synthase F1 subunit delta [Eubacterium sp.]|nr:ATP synthase F1 subunit delta [Eubacterium sp.]